MALTEAFKRAADIYQDHLDDKLVESMKEREYVFLSFSWINNSPPHPSPSWRSILYKIGEEDDLEGDFVEQDPAFTVTHKKTGITVSGNGSVSLMSELWIRLHDEKAI